LSIHPVERKAAPARLEGIEDRCSVRVGEYDRAFASADEDLERENAEKTSSVHLGRRRGVYAAHGPASDPAFPAVALNYSSFFLSSEARSANG
jgi:hypothetical protein